MRTHRILVPNCFISLTLLLLALPRAVSGQVLVQDVFNGSDGALPDAAKYVWSGQFGQYGTGLLYLATDAVDESWLRSTAGAAPGAGQTLDLQIRVYAYAENWNPGVYGDKQPRGLRVGNDPNNAVEFYSASRTSVGMRVRKDGVESGATYALPSGVDTLHDYEIAVTTTGAVFKVDGTVAGTFNANIPTGVLNVYADSWDGGGTGNVPIGIASLTLSLTNNQVQGPPVINSFTPASGPEGTSVAICGTNFIGVTNVQFGGTTAVFTNNSDSLITAIVPAGAATGLITVVSTNGTVTSSNNFVVTPIDFTYMTNNNTITIKQYTGSGGTVIIPNTISGLPVTSIGDGAFQTISSVANVIIPDSVTNIGSHAFYFCTGLTNVTIGSGVTSIGDYAFYFCSGLDNMNIPDSVTSIGECAFYYCMGLTDVTIGNGVTSIGQDAFYHCARLTDVTIPDGVTSIGSYAFYFCNSVTNVMIGSGVTSLGSYAFIFCTSLSAITVNASNSAYCSADGVLFDKNQTTLIQWPGNKAGICIIPNSVTGIAGCAFYYCSGLTNVMIGSGVTSIGSYAFYGCTSLSAITVNASNSAYCSVDGVLFNQSRTILIQYPFGKAGSYAMPDGVTSIGDSAFFFCTGLVNINMPDSVTSIGNNAFYYCTGLTNVVIGNGVTSIGDSAFYNCVNLTCVTIPDSVTSIKNSAFNFCYSLTAIYFKGNAPGLGGDVFYGANSSLVAYCFPGTTNWASPFGSIPVVQWNPQAQTCDANFGIKENKFGFNITGTSNLVIVVEATTNLAGPWTAVSTNTLNTFIGTNGTSYFCDSQWTNHPGCFYRFRSP